MKKLITLFFSLFYFIAASGVYVQAHFCADELSSVNYFAFHENDDCGCGDEPAGEDCCKDVMHFYKVNAHHEAGLVKANQIFSKPGIQLFTAQQLFNLFFVFRPAFDYANHAPPPFLFTKSSLFVLNCVFRI
jgi:hypothetical protein